MNEIPYEELKQYVKMIYDLETSLFQQETLIKKLKKDCSSQVPDAPEAPQLPGKLSERKKTSLTFWGMLVLAIALIVLPFILKVGIGWKLLIGFFSITFAIIILFPAFGVVGPDIGTSKTEAEETAEYNSNVSYCMMHTMLEQFTLNTVILLQSVPSMNIWIQGVVWHLQVMRAHTTATKTTAKPI